MSKTAQVILIYTNLVWSLLLGLNLIIIKDMVPTTNANMKLMRGHNHESGFAMVINPMKA